MLAGLAITVQNRQYFHLSFSKKHIYILCSPRSCKRTDWAGSTCFQFRCQLEHVSIYPCSRIVPVGMECYQRDPRPQGLLLTYQAVYYSEICAIQVVYLSSMSLFIVGSAIVAISKSICLVIGMRAAQAAGWVSTPISLLCLGSLGIPAQFKRGHGYRCWHPR